TKTQELPPQMRKNFFPWRVAEPWNCCPGRPGVSLSGDIPVPPGCAPVPPALGGPAWAGGWAGGAPEVPPNLNNPAIPTLGEAWAQLKKSLADEAEVHLKFSSKLQSEVEKPLLNFRENFKKDMKKCDHHIADLRKHLASRYTAVEKARKALTERQKDLEMKTQQLEVKLSNKTEEEIKKARRKSTQAGDDLMRCVDLYNQAQSKWFEEMVTTTLELERLEVERVEMIRQHLCQYTQLRHETDMFNQSTVELVDQLLRKVDPAKDRELWVKEHKTGDIRPVDMEI
uniref:Growth arrest specific 7 n=1 Tax=Serinus canaria TaxID=9135 RepID=A0A8C9MJW8_SERCA